MKGKRVMLKRRKKVEVEELTQYSVHLLPKPIKLSEAKKKDFVKSGEIGIFRRKIGKWIGSNKAKKLEMDVNSEVVDVGLAPYNKLFQDKDSPHKHKVKDGGIVSLGYGQEILKELEREVIENHPKVKGIGMETKNPVVNKLAKKLGYELVRINRDKLFADTYTWVKCIRKKPIKKRVMLKRAKKKDDLKNLVYHVYLPHKVDEKTGEPLTYHKTGKVLLFKDIIQKRLDGRLPHSAKEAGIKWGDKCFEVSMYPYEDAYGSNPPKIGMGHEIYQELEKRILKNHPDIDALVMLTSHDNAERIPQDMGFTHVHELGRLSRLGFRYYVKKLKKPKK